MLHFRNSRPSIAEFEVGQPRASDLGFYNSVTSLALYKESP